MEMTFHKFIVYIMYNLAVQLTEITESWKTSSRKSGMLTTMRYQTQAEHKWATVTASNGIEVRILSQGTRGRELKGMHSDVVLANIISQDSTSKMKRNRKETNQKLNQYEIKQQIFAVLNPARSPVHSFSGLGGNSINFLLV